MTIQRRQLIQACAESATDRGNTVHIFTPAQREEFIKLSASIDDEWVADMDKRGFKGAQLLATASR